MNIREAYNQWSAQYDTNTNKTRDLEGHALRQLLDPLTFASCLELGCGTGKNTSWLQQKALRLTAVDFSEKMLALASKKIRQPHVQFVQADLREAWHFAGSTPYDLVCCSLVLEHLQTLDPLFAKAAAALAPGGWLYVGELHPFKQYSGSKARFETSQGLQVVSCYTHHVSDFVQAAHTAGLQLHSLQEYFDEGERSGLPRILALLFRKPFGAA